jgi:hypothetical protein
LRVGPIVREHWEVFGAAGIFAVVLLVIDAGSLGAPVLGLSLVPLAFLVLAALIPLTIGQVLIWISGILLLAIIEGEPRFVGLAYPAVIVFALLAVERWRARSA